MPGLVIFSHLAENNEVILAFITCMIYRNADSLFLASPPSAKVVCLQELLISLATKWIQSLGLYSSPSSPVRLCGY
jgi:hypothetical protein